MTRAEAIKCIEEDGIRLGAGDFVDVEALKVAVECMKEQDVTDINVGCKWISVKDRLPEVGLRVLVCSLYDLQNIGWHLGDGRWQIKTAYPDTPTHWMPLPEPPKEDAG